ncbi:MAG: hypothetical protein NTZ69_02770 [Bacteroidia bacterium]|nr:hypothetical protein [Bacteroidia bacterium]
MKLSILIILSVLSIICLIVLIVALTDIYPVQQLIDNRFVVVIVFLSIGGFTRQAFKKYREQTRN